MSHTTILFRWSHGALGITGWGLFWSLWLAYASASVHQRRGKK